MAQLLKRTPEFKANLISKLTIPLCPKECISYEHTRD